MTDVVIDYYGTRLKIKINLESVCQLANNNNRKMRLANELLCIGLQIRRLLSKAREMFLQYRARSM